jgi:urea transporter
LLAKNLSGEKSIASKLAPTQTQHTFFRQLTQGYAWVLLLPSARAGMALLLLTFVSPLSGLAGLIAASVSLLVARWMRVVDALVPVFVFNGLLTGLLLESHYIPNFQLAVLLVLAAVLAALMSAWLAAAWWRFAALPILSLPFVLSAWLADFAAASYAMLLPVQSVSNEAAHWSAAFSSSLGSVYSQPDVYLGAAMFLVILFTSRTLAFMALLGFVAGMAWQALLNDGLAVDLLPSWSFNSILAAMAVGGLFVVPGRASMMLAMVSAILAAFFSAALTKLLAPLGLSPLALPFLLATWLCLYAAQRSGKPALVGERVILPEITLEETRLARARLGDPASTGLNAPFFGEWQVSQGVDGEHTHRGIWRNALDFIVTVEGLSFRNSGRALKDYYCFDLPVVSPCHGQVVQVENSVADNAPGEVNLRENWGNYVLIRLYYGVYVLLAHLRQGSVVVNVGDYVNPGAALGNCGNSGRSPQPHLHLSLVSGEFPGAATLPFHLVGVLMRTRQEKDVFHLWSNVAQGDGVTAASQGAVRPLTLKVGQGRTFRARNEDGGWIARKITTQLTLDGRFRLMSDSGASCLCVWDGALFACYAREGSADEYFDLWMLAIGCTPSSEHAELWRDQPSTRLVPAGVLGVTGMLLYPFVTQLESEYRRSWDEAAQRWQQTGNFLFAGVHVLEIYTEIASDKGVTRLFAKADGKCWEMELTGAFQEADEGVPQSEWALKQ